MDLFCLATSSTGSSGSSGISSSSEHEVFTYNQGDSVPAEISCFMVLVWIPLI